VKTTLAVICAVGSAIALNYAMFVQKKAVDHLPRIQFRPSWDVFKAFATNRTWLASIVFAVVGGGLYSVALALTGVSIVAPIVASGIALLAYLAIKHLGEKPRKIDLLAIGISILGVVLIGVSLGEEMTGGGSGSATVKYDAATLWIVAGAIILLSIVIPLLMRLGGGSHEAAGMGIAVGLLFGIGAVFARILLYDWTTGFKAKGVLVVFSSVYLLAWAVTFVPAFILLQAALQRGMAIIVVPVQAGLAQLVPISVGMLVLGEKFPANDALMALRIAGFALVLVGTVILAQRSEEVLPAQLPDTPPAGGGEPVAAGVALDRAADSIGD